MNKQVQQFIENYNLFHEDTIQQTQLQHRFALVEAFKIEPGMRVLEIGCGQGDTTVILADAVGATGSVVAIDIASPEYGAPFTLGQAQQRILESPLGGRISFYLETDFLEFEFDGPFDAIVLSHCSWYFKSAEQLSAYFKKMHSLSKRICFAEWDLAFTDIAQRSHFCAVSILALHSQFIENDGNIQNIFGKTEITELAKDAGFTLESNLVVDASFLQDGAWEKDYANYVRPKFASAPAAIQSLVSTYYEVMNSVKEENSLNSFVFLFEA